MCTSLFALFKLRWGRGVKKNHTHTHKKIIHCAYYTRVFLFSLHTCTFVNMVPFLFPCSPPMSGFSPPPPPPRAFIQGQKKKKILKRKDAVVHPPKGLTAAVPSHCVAKDHLFLPSDAPVLSECLVSSLVRYCDCIRSKAKLFFFFFFWTSHSISVPVV